ncbi:upstream stimulatory factor 2 [Platysternon megacephalum]|uniref:Upstream stimulatory factor 2 n=1 Tax=Platysternon megacephalum TaxID=55544 RepID=A0A4D9DK92_9SAUR|nr:upstream stimulatory factor 2 [Platysternon megacephalum]
METCFILSLWVFSQLGAVLGDSVRSNEPEVSGSEGDTVTLSCSYETSYTAGVYLYWYRKYPNRAPQYILLRGAKGIRTSDTAGFAKKRFSSQATDSSTVLNITTLELADTAVYLCALRLAQ